MPFPTLMLALLHLLSSPNSAMPIGVTDSGNTNTSPAVPQPSMASAQTYPVVVSAHVGAACVNPFAYACDAWGSQMMQCVSGTFTALGAPCKCQYIKGIPECVL
ncbi:hypothetical protein BC830DRAFT_1218073 [Chytriomyces sp. MP71]|nr:hypothetical protein BC830DRAFT_1218073 [Chytriomyces sp. MP71]